MEGKVDGYAFPNKSATTVMTWDQACRGAGGRRAYNRLRQLRADYRLTRVAELLHQTGLGRGWQTRVAEALGVSRSTICRDFQRLRRRAMFGLESDKFARGLALAAKHARDDARADREYDARKNAAIAASSNEMAASELDDEFAVLEAHDELAPQPVTPPIQVPRWLPTPPCKTTSRFRRPMSGGLYSRHLRRQ
jgi:hypothetical protein